MSAAARLFFAAPLPESAQPSLARLTDALRSNLPAGITPRFVPIAKQHVTLKFLGNVEAGALAALEALVDDAVGGEPPIPAVLDSVTGFGRPPRAHVVVLRLIDPDRRLTALAEKLESGARALGLRREERAFSAHVTLARLARPADIRDWIRAIPPLSEPVRFDRVALYRSELGSGGSRYQAVCTRMLEGGC